MESLNHVKPAGQVAAVPSFLRCAPCSRADRQDGHAWPATHLGILLSLPDIGSAPVSGSTCCDARIITVL